jgi:hypothetical protein
MATSWKRQRRNLFDMLLLLKVITFSCMLLAATVLGDEIVVPNGECESNNNDGKDSGQCLATVHANSDEAEMAYDDDSNGNIPWYRDLSECNDNDRDCGVWAAKNECAINPNGMLQLCPKACKVCDNEYGEYISNCYGEDQLVSGATRKETEVRVREVEDYMLQEVFVEEKYKNIRAECKNRDKECSFWAVIGGKKRK